MKKQQNDAPSDVQEEKTDLKHDTMEFSAATDGDDKLDTDDERYEEEGITAEELDIIEEDAPDDLAAALNSAESDRLVDEDNLPDEDWTDDLPNDVSERSEDEI